MKSGSLAVAALFTRLPPHHLFKPYKVVAMAERSRSDRARRASLQRPPRLYDPHEIPWYAASEDYIDLLVIPIVQKLAEFLAGETNRGDKGGICAVGGIGRSRRCFFHDCPRTASGCHHRHFTQPTVPIMFVPAALPSQWRFLLDSVDICVCVKCV